MANDLGFALGDIVTRDGTDLHLVTRLDDDGHSGQFLCVQAPRTGWISEGESESNLARRYSYVCTPEPGDAPPVNQPVNLRCGG